ncbi:MAG TPA: serine/threonine protein kinase [Psychromonas hadalis]|nr:serine/threonine protein kinase [Psychromonas hadalis]
MAMNISFSNLTPECQLDALASVGIYPQTGLIALNSYENRVLLFTDENDQRYVLKFYRPQRWSEAQIREEHAFCLELQNQGVELSAPVIIDGESLFCFQGYFFALYKSLSGRTAEVDNQDQIYDIGVLLGKMHKAAKPINIQHRETLDVSTLLREPLTRFKESALIPAFIKADLLDVIAQVADKAETIFKKTLFQKIPLHGDCHFSNILMVDEQPYFVDFDDCKTGPAIQDLWMLLSGDQKDQQQQLATLIEGYEEELTFDLAELTLIEALRSIRIVNYMIWINFRWSDPTFHVNFPWFTSDDYWKEQLQSLKLQLKKMDLPPLTIQPVFEAPYFY